MPYLPRKGIRLPLGVQGTMVGKAAIGEINQLRSLKIQEPWTGAAAEEMETESMEEWLAEQCSPPLDCMPQVSEKSIQLVRALVSTSPITTNGVRGTRVGSHLKSRGWSNLIGRIFKG